MQLKEIVILRSLIIILVVVLHSFINYCGGWKPIVRIATDVLANNYAMVSFNNNHGRIFNHYGVVKMIYNW